ncbi:hypothetical protein LPAF129_01860 [Ligilactobacillus pabuli]|uniref:Uncharacterized protein n=1 Tax=Ligilactobacillus pabuli TaxID=2886039 RepID=A0ABQ5JIG9_9LACO|nr:hypothetical protein [Ligilactobacillus pabuli]GKS80501.1 hypothetical protein LPAF129_01860 [Ligilactobacillus pabuli]
MNIKYQAVGQTIYDMYLIQNVERYLTGILTDKLEDTSLRLELISKRQLKQEHQLNLLDGIEPLLQMRGREIEQNGLYLLLSSQPTDGPQRFLDCGPFSEHGVSLMFHNPGFTFNSDDEIFKAATDCMNVAARLSAHFFASDLALSQIPANIYRSFYNYETNCVTAVLVTEQEFATDTQAVQQLAATYRLQIVSGLQQDLNGKKQAILRLTKQLAN